MLIIIMLMEKKKMNFNNTYHMNLINQINFL